MPVCKELARLEWQDKLVATTTETIDRFKVATLPVLRAGGITVAEVAELLGRNDSGIKVMQVKGRLYAARQTSVLQLVRKHAI